METVGDAYDNAMAESFFAGLECELIDRLSWKSKTEERHAVFAWIEPVTIHTNDMVVSVSSHPTILKGGLEIQENLCVKQQI